jgi:putative aldouronate transport system substrate-binding protein
MKGRITVVAVIVLFLCAVLPVSAKGRADAGPKAGGDLTTFSMWLGESWLIPTVGLGFNDPIAQRIKEKTGVAFRYTTAKSNEWQNELNVMMASGDLPDLINHDGSYIGNLKAGKYIIALDDLIDKHGPNLKKRLGDAMEFWRDPDDGKLYQVKVWAWNDPSYVLPIRGPYLMMRYDILKEIGFANVGKDRHSNITWQEYETILERVKARYPDMVPLLIGEDIFSTFNIVKASTGVRQAISGASTSSFGYENNTARYLYDSAHSLDVLRFLNRLYNKGLVDRSFVTLKLDQIQARIASGDVFSYMGEGTPVGDSFQAIIGDREERRYTMYNLVKDQSITRTYVNGYYISGVGSISVSSKCQNPEQLIRFFDFCASEEGSFLLNAGVEGIHHRRDSSGNVVPDPEAAAAYANWDTSFFQRTGLTSYVNIFPTLAGLDAKGNAADIFAQEMYTNNRWNIFDNKWWANFMYRGDYFTGVMDFNPDTQQVANDAYSKIQSYADDWIKRCIIVKPEQLEAEWNRLYDQMKRDGVEQINAAINANLQKRMKVLSFTLEEAFK